MKVATRNVLIIGAGVAGMAAARLLSQGGLSVIIAEARDRVGGRIHTIHGQDDFPPIELGAEFVHGRSPELFEIIEAAGLRVEEVSNRHWYFEDGKLHKSHEFWNKVEELMKRMDDDEPDISFQSFLETLPNDEETKRAKRIAARYVEGFHAAPLDRIGVHGLIKANEAAAEIDGDRSFRLVDGYDGVINWLQNQAETHGTVIRLRTEVKELRWWTNRVTAICSSEGHDEVILSEKALVTVPLSRLAAFPQKLDAIQFVPALPEEVTVAIQKLSMGDVVRLVFEFRRRFWETLKVPGIAKGEDLSNLGFIHYPEAPLATWWTLLPDPAAVLIGWAGGPPATVLSSTREELLKAGLNSLATMFGVDEVYLGSMLVDFQYHDWRTDPLTRGGYTFVPVDGLTAQNTLAKPVDDTIFFAGEATSVGHIGTVHGAISSGCRAAKQILALQ